MRRRYLLPVAYFLFCELLDLVYEVDLIDGIGLLGVILALILVSVSSPGYFVGRWVQEWVATMLNIPLADTVAYNSFWPRFLGMQASIFAGTIFLLCVLYLIKRFALDKQT